MRRLPFLQSRGILTRKMGAYGLPQHLRITIGTGPEMETVAKALGEFMAAMIMAHLIVPAASMPAKRESERRHALHGAVRITAFARDDRPGMTIISVPYER